LGHRIIPLLREFNPKVFAHERAFANSRTPGAFEPLVSSITIMINSVLDYNPLTQISTFSPGQVKNAMGQKGNCKKEEMKLACKVDKRLNTFVDANLISEHEIDAVAIGLCCLDVYRPIKILLL
jgi:Holliday junction resolvasome RuvABC endonuclease subunit